MRLRTQFILTMLLFGATLVVIAASAIITSREVEKAARQERIAAAIAQGAGELSYLSNDYLIYRESQQLKRWRSRFAAFSAEVDALAADRPECRALVANIHANQHRMKEVFDSATSTLGSPSRNRRAALDPAFQVSWSRMAVQSQGLVSDATRLSQLLRQQMDRLTRTRTLLMYVMVGLFGLFLIAGYMLTYRRILKSIGTLRAGAAVIGSGNLDFIIEEERNDEIGNLSRAFNRMTTDLKAVTASKSDLEREIAARKKGEEELRESRAKLEAALASMTDAVFISDTQGRFIDFNDAFATFHKFRNKDECSKTFAEYPDILDVFLPDGTLAPLDMWAVPRALRGETATNAEYTLQRKDTGERWVGSYGFGPIRDKDGVIVGSVVVGRDVTERKRMEEELRKSRDELESRVHERTEELRVAYEKLKEEIAERERAEAQLRQTQKMEALGTLSGGIAHDFNNILAAIIGFTELMAGRAAKGSRDERHLQRIMEASIRGRDLVRQMLAFSRKTEQEKKPLRVSSIVKETVALIRAAIPATISIRVNTLSEPELILADPTQIQQVLMNLCTNASHAMREKGGTLDIDLDGVSVSPSNCDPQEMRPGLYARLIVRDTGTGMPPDIIDRIFDPFFTTKKLGEGTGLGLSVVHGIVKQHNGYIFVESEPGKGSIFTVYFPKISGEPETDAAGDGALPTGSERILFVDDEEALVEMGEDVLAELGYQVTARMSSREALALFRVDPSRFDLVITDQTMPEMTGVDVAREILALRPGTPIIMCTGFSHLVDADKAKAAGIRAFAMKPLTKGEVARTIRKVLDG